MNEHDGANSHEKLKMKRNFFRQFSAKSVGELSIPDCKKVELAYSLNFRELAVITMPRAVSALLETRASKSPAISFRARSCTPSCRLSSRH